MARPYPPEVLTRGKGGRSEVRNLLDRGRFVRYEYLDPTTGRRLEEKVKLVLSSGDHLEEYFVIPMKDGKRHLLISAEEKGTRRLWNGEKAVDLWE